MRFSGPRPADTFVSSLLCVTWMGRRRRVTSRGLRLPPQWKGQGSERPLEPAPEPPDTPGSSGPAGGDAGQSPRGRSRSRARCGRRWPPRVLARRRPFRGMELSSRASREPILWSATCTFQENKPIQESILVLWRYPAPGCFSAPTPHAPPSPRCLPFRCLNAESNAHATPKSSWRVKN